MMARRKRASMREGPLADLFRSTSDDPSQEPPEFDPSESGLESAPVADAPEEAKMAEEQAPAGPDPEPLSLIHLSEPTRPY